ncbi:MAG: hypothetical protein GF416_05425 [Candidatus Altiarchaeales archaeon]|nr:hypothetical protein [Candidatus Altiarchaeales archaeon]MBD3416558.1 hypothetical protein [Candidatus Altiarchaeales archaeon]
MKKKRRSMQERISLFFLVLAAAVTAYSLLTHLSTEDVGEFQWYFSENVTCNADSNLGQPGWEEINVPFTRQESGRNVCFLGVSHSLKSGDDLSLEVRVDDSIRGVYLNGETAKSIRTQGGWRKVVLTDSLLDGENRLVVSGYNIAKNVDLNVVRETPNNMGWLCLGLVFAFILTAKDLGRKPGYLLFAAALIIVIYLFPAFGRYNYWGIGDWNQFQTFYQSAKNTIVKYHQFPLWNPYICGGNVQLAYPQPGFLSPYLITLLVFDVAHGIKINLALYFITGVIGCYLLSRKMGLGAYSTLLFSMTFVLSGYFAHRINQGHVPTLIIVYLPLIVYLYWKTLEDFKYAPLMAVVVALYVLEAHPFLTTLVMMFLVFYSVFLSGTTAVSITLRGEKRRARSWAKYLPAAKPLTVAVAVSLLAAMLVGFKVVPGLDFAHDNPRMVSDDTGFNRGLLKDALLLGKKSENRHSWGWHEYNGYIGVVPLILAVLGMLLSLRKPKLLALMMFLAFITMYSFNEYSPVNLWELFHKLPLFSSQHLPMRSIAYITFILSFFAGLGLDRIERANSHLAKLVLVFVVVNLFTVNTNLIEGTFRYTPRMDYESSIGAFHQAEDVDDRGSPSDNMYSFVLQDVGVTNCYAPGGLNNHATPVQRANYRGEAYLMGGSGSARVFAFSPNQVDVIVDTPAPNVVVINQNYYEGWSADGIAAENTRGLVSARVDAGKKMVSFSYEPPGLKLGVALSLLGLLLSAIIYRGEHRKMIARAECFVKEHLLDSKPFRGMVLGVLLAAAVLSTNFMVGEVMQPDDVWTFYTGGDVDGWYELGFDEAGWERRGLPFEEDNIGQILARGTVYVRDVEKAYVEIVGDDCISEFYINERKAYETRSCGHMTHCNGKRFDLRRHVQPGANKFALKILNSGGGPGRFNIRWEDRSLRTRLFRVDSLPYTLLLLSLLWIAFIHREKPMEYLARKASNAVKASKRRKRRKKTVDSVRDFRKVVYALLLISLISSAYFGFEALNSSDIRGSWRFQTGAEPKGWYTEDFEDGAWTAGEPEFRRSQISHMLVRGEVRIDRVKDAVASIVGDDCISEFYINDKRIFETRDCGHMTHCNGKRFDLTEHVRKGGNTFALKILNSGGGPGRFNIRWLNRRNTTPAVISMALSAILLLLILQDITKLKRVDGYIRLIAGKAVKAADRMLPVLLLAIILGATFFTLKHGNTGYMDKKVRDAVIVSSAVAGVLLGAVIHLRGGEVISARTFKAVCILGALFYMTLLFLPRGFNADAAMQSVFAFDILKGEKLTHYNATGYLEYLTFIYPLLPFYALLGHQEVLIKALIVAYELVFIVFLYKLVRLWYGVNAARYAAFFALFSGAMTFVFSPYLSPATTIPVIAIYLLESGGRKRRFLGFVLGGVSYYYYYHMPFYVILVYVVVEFIFNPGRIRRDYTALAVAALIVLPGFQATLANPSADKTLNGFLVGADTSHLGWHEYRKDLEAVFQSNYKLATINPVLTALTALSILYFIFKALESGDRVRFIYENKSAVFAVLFFLMLFPVLFYAPYVQPRVYRFALPAFFILAGVFVGKVSRPGAARIMLVSLLVIYAGVDVYNHFDYVTSRKSISPGEFEYGLGEASSYLMMQNPRKVYVDHRMEHQLRFYSGDKLPVREVNTMGKCSYYVFWSNNRENTFDRPNRKVVKTIDYPWGEPAIRIHRECG